jgi:hypothetical protein
LSGAAAGTEVSVVAAKVGTRDVAAVATGEEAGVGIAVAVVAVTAEAGAETETGEARVLTNTTTGLDLHPCQGRKY